MSEISKFHPYNVLWAQLGDLYGSIGNPSRLAKTIICGAHTVTINKVLNVLTYFVRCGEIQRIKSTQILDTNEIEEMISSKAQRKSVTVLDNVTISVETKENQAKGLTRSRTCMKEISTVCHEEPVFRENAKSYEFQAKASFVRQPIEIDHQSIDTNRMENGQNNQYSANNTIKLMVTSPNNDRFEYETASEAIDFILKKVEPTEKDEHRQSVDETKQNRNKNQTRRSLWSIDTVTDGISIDKWKPFATDEPDNEQIKNSDLRRSHSLKTKSNTMSSLRRSKTFREIKVNELENGNHDQSQADDSNLLIERSENQPIDALDSVLVPDTNLNTDSRRADNDQTLKPTGSVVFVLGDDEVLSGLKIPQPSPISSAVQNNSTVASAPIRSHDLQCESIAKPHANQAIGGENHSTNLTTTARTIATSPAAVAPAPKPKSNKQETKKKHCTHKKHSGVKFNFEQYPQIVTNYMKNKNLDITSYDFLEKGLKLEQENAFNNGASSTSFLPMFTPEDIQEQDEQQEEEECECCANTFRILQTPSNATELEFSNDDAIYPVPVASAAAKTLATVNENDSLSNATDSVDPDSGRSSRIEAEPIEIDEATNKDKKSVIADGRKENGDNSKRTSNSNDKDCLELITLPIPKTQIIQDTKSRYRLRPGYVPSLFVGITDHFIPDMVLQVNFSFSFDSK